MNIDQERSAFEAWCNEEGFSLVNHPIRIGMYENHHTQGMWEAYQKGRSDVRANSKGQAMTLKKLKRLALLEQEEIKQADCLLNGKTAYKIVDSVSGEQIGISLYTKSGLVKRYMGDKQ